MEHEVFVPVPAERLSQALADPARVARAVPGLQQDAGTDPVSGRLKVRVGSHSITYRGSVRVTPQQDGSYAVEGDATEARGSGSVELALTLRLRDAEGGSTLIFEGTASADGRVTDFPAEAVGSAAVRLLNRFAENLGAAGDEPTTPESAATEDFEPLTTGDFEATPDAEDTPAPPSSEDTEKTEKPEKPEKIGNTGKAENPEKTEKTEKIGNTGKAENPEKPEKTGNTGKAEGTVGDAEDTPDATGERSAPAEDFAETPEPPAEAAHARRTMIGRSAEEVDHAPPRGRYAPVPAPQTVTPTTTLRWAAPAAALVVASAIVVGRALRRRR